MLSHDSINSIQILYWPYNDILTSDFTPKL